MRSGFVTLDAGDGVMCKVGFPDVFGKSAAIFSASDGGERMAPALRVVPTLQRALGIGGWNDRRSN
jgi:hypothetical protein